MIDDIELLHLHAPVGKGQENNPDDVEALDGRLRTIKAYAPPPEYADYAQRYATEAMISALERYQEKHGLKIDGVALPGGPTERAINNQLLEKPRGAGLLYDPPSSLYGTVGSGFENRRGDVVGVKRRLGALGYLPEDPFDRPHGFIDEATTSAIKAFQRANGLAADGWLAPQGETERALNDATGHLVRARDPERLAYAARARGAQPRAVQGAVESKNLAWPNGSIEVQPATFDRRYPFGFGQPLLEGGWVRMPGGMGSPSRGRGTETPPRPPGIPFGVPIPDTTRPRKDDVPEAPRPPRQPLSDPGVYIPEPGSPLRIPIIDYNPYGRPGNKKTIQTTEEAMDAIQKECEQALKGTGATFERKRERYYPPFEGKEGQRRESSYADGWVQIKIGDIKIDFVADTYTPKASGLPTQAENGRYVKLEKNLSDIHRAVIRVPKGWVLGQQIDKEKLSEATRKICEQIRNLLDNGYLAHDKKKQFIPKLLDDLVKPKPARVPRPERPLPSPP